MSKRHVQWLYEELPDLVGRGVVPGEVAEKLRQHYGDVEGGGGKRWAIILFSILGAALIGAGIILLLAHNWDDLSRPVRMVLSLMPMLAAQGLAAYVLLKQRASTAWREGVGMFWALAIGASIALVGQTYHLYGDFGAFMLSWTLAGLPVVYLLNSSVAAILFWVGATTWAGDVCGTRGMEIWFWPLAALAVPHLVLAAWRNRYHVRVGLLSWVLAICGAIGIGFTLAHRSGHDWIPVYTGYFALLYMLGSLWFNEGRTFWQRPLQTLGALGVIVLAIVLTFEDPWDHYWRCATWLALLNGPATGWVQVGILVLWPLAAIGLWAYSWVRREPITLLFGALPVLGIIGSMLASAKAGVVILILMNLYVFALGVALIVLGVRDRRLGVVNLGMLITAALVIARFFDADLSFILRGLAFIAVGVGFLVTNVVLIRRTKGVK